MRDWKDGLSFAIRRLLEVRVSLIPSVCILNVTTRSRVDTRTLVETLLQTGLLQHSLNSAEEWVLATKQDTWGLGSQELVLQLLVLLQKPCILLPEEFVLLLKFLDMNLLVSILFGYDLGKHDIQSVGIQIQISEVKESGVLTSCVAALVVHPLALVVPLKFGPTPVAIVI